MSQSQSIWIDRQLRMMWDLYKARTPRYGFQPTVTDVAGFHEWLAALDAAAGRDFDASALEMVRLYRELDSEEGA